MERGQVRTGKGGVQTTGEQCEGWGSIGVEWKGVEGSAEGWGGKGLGGVEWSGAGRGGGGVE